MQAVSRPAREQSRSQTADRRYPRSLLDVVLPALTRGSLIVLVGKKNLEVRPMAINKGEVVKRILYLNSDARFIFYAGDDKVCLTRHLFFLVVLTQNDRRTRTCSARYTSRRRAYR